jgi:hypothetical protein
VKRLLAVVVGVFGIRALLRRRSQPALTYSGSPSPAADLKARLAESRTSESRTSESRSSEPRSSEPRSSEPVSSQPESSETESEPTVDEKRVDVHNRARGAIDELKS